MLRQRFDSQRLSNGYELVDGVAMNREEPDNFLIPPDVIKRNVQPGQFVELRIDSPRFSVHQEDAEHCSCPSCGGALSKPILRHEQPASLIELPDQKVPSRGWGEDFWVRVVDRQGSLFLGRIDNALVESRLHGLHQDDEVAFGQQHILAVHDLHRQELVAGMSGADLKELAQWLGSLRRDDEE